MTAVNVGSIADYNNISPDNFAELLEHKSNGTLLSESSLWVVDQTQMAGVVQISSDESSSITNLAETLDINSEVIFDGLAFTAPESPGGQAGDVGEETFNSQTGDTQTSPTQNTTVQGSSSGGSGGTTDTSGSSLTGSSVTTSFKSSSTGGSGGGETLNTPSTGGGNSSGSGGNTTTGDGGTTTTGDGGTTTTGDGGTTTTGDSGTTTTDGGGTTTTTQASSTTSGDTPADVPFSLTESLGLGLLLCIVGGHKLLKHRAKRFKAA